MLKARYSYMPALLIFFAVASISPRGIAQDAAFVPISQSAARLTSLSAPNLTSPQMIPGDHSTDGTALAAPMLLASVGADASAYPAFSYTRATLEGAAEPDGSPAAYSTSAPGGNDTLVAENLAVSQPGGIFADADAPNAQPMQATPPPPQVEQTTREIKREARRWHVGGRIGAGFSPELFMFGLQSQIGPVFNPHVLFRPNADFSFGELTDMFAINLEGVYRFRKSYYDQWTPYFGMGPSLNFIHQGTSTSNVSFSDFTYKTGFNVLIGAQKRRTFVEMKTSLWSGPAPVLRLILGYNF